MIHSTSFSHRIFGSFSQIDLSHLLIIEQTPSLPIKHHLALSYEQPPVCESQGHLRILLYKKNCERKFFPQLMENLKQILHQ